MVTVKRTCEVCLRDAKSSCMYKRHAYTQYDAGNYMIEDSSLDCHHMAMFCELVKMVLRKRHRKLQVRTTNDKDCKFAGKNVTTKSG